MTQIEQIFRTHFENNRTDDRDLDLLHATDAVREFIASETNRQRISLPHWCNLAKLDQVYGNKGVFGRFCQELQDDLDAAKAKLAEKEDPLLKEINDLKEELEAAKELAEFRGNEILKERSRADCWRKEAESLKAQLEEYKKERRAQYKKQTLRNYEDSDLLTQCIAEIRG